MSASTFQLQLDDVNGWLRITIQDDNQEVLFFPDGILADSMLDLAQALNAIWNGRSDAIMVVWYSLPQRFEFHFIPHNGDEFAFRIDEYPSHHPDWHKRTVYFETRTTRKVLCLTFWRAIRKYQSQVSFEAYARYMKHPFPAEAVARLTAAIQTNS
jgi:hypothetical protein